MPAFTVVIQREIVEEIEVVVEAEKEENITNDCLSSVIYEGVAAVKNSRHWNAVVNELWLDVDRVRGTGKKPQFILEKMDDDWVLLTAPKKPRVDPRQLPLLKEEALD